MSATIGHPGALRRLANAHPEPSKAKAVAMVTIPATSLWAGPKGIERGNQYVVALFPTKLVLLHQSRRPSPEALLAEFPRKVYRVTDVGQDLVNLSFQVVLPYGQMQMKMGRRGPYAVNAEVLEALVASAATAERAEERTGGRAPLQTAGDVAVFARMCAAHGPGAEAATAVAEAQVTGSSARKGLLAQRPDLVLAAFPDRVLLLDRNHTTHVASTPVAAFTKGGCTITVTAEDSKHVEMTLAGEAGTVSVRMSRYGEDRIDGLVLDAVLAMNG
ncbi:hypothetical protein [Sporichthya sp.]|uniref:hypothetical protein n=1 Tax=Sporichthya sp. TaxID=65475 RepID=UPI00179DD475|nr:hypothetical protein [Sporichthya sp.]MBA3743583.1 hypothetical protein [Sporichthya sp.]